jgi:hypothetical protein
MAYVVKSFAPILFEGPSKTQGSNLGGELLMNFYEKGRKQEISSGSAFANAEQDRRMPLILHGKDFLKRCSVISAT